MKYVWSPAPGSTSWKVVVDGTPSSLLTENNIILNNLTVGSTHELDVYMGCASYSDPLSNTPSEQINTNLLSIDNTYASVGNFTIQFINTNSTLRITDFQTDIMLAQGFDWASGYLTSNGFPILSSNSSSLITLTTSGMTGYYNTCNWVLKVYNPSGSYITSTVYFQRNMVNNLAVAQTTYIAPGATVNMPITIDFIPQIGDAILMQIN